MRLSSAAGTGLYYLDDISEHMMDAWGLGTWTAYRARFCKGYLNQKFKWLAIL